MFFILTLFIFITTTLRANVIQMPGDKMVNDKMKEVKEIFKNINVESNKTKIPERKLVNSKVKGSNNTLNDALKRQDKVKNDINEAFAKANLIHKKGVIKTDINFDEIEMPKNFYKDLKSGAEKITEVKNKITKTSGIYVCISLSMPEIYLKEILREAKIVNAQVAIRGLHGNFKKTLLKVRKLSPDFGVMINPALFKKHNVKAVPTLILEDSEKVYRVKGAVSIEYFLRTVARRGDNDNKIASKYLSKYKGRR